MYSWWKGGNADHNLTEQKWRDGGGQVQGAGSLLRKENLENETFKLTVFFCSNMCISLISGICNSAYFSV